MGWLKEKINSGFIQRRISYYTILGLTVYCVYKTWWIIEFGVKLGYNGTEVAMMTGAAWAPMSYLMKSVFDKHKDYISREGQNVS